MGLPAVGWLTLCLRKSVFCGLTPFRPFSTPFPALDMNCQYFLSEDMQDGLVINDKLTIVNPFSDS